MAKAKADGRKKELQHNFSEYLKPQGKKAYKTTVSDSFYLYNNNPTVDFFALLEIEDFEQFKSTAENLLFDTLSVKSAAKGANLSSYVSAITRLWAFVHQK